VGSKYALTAGGKNVAPGPLEDRLREHPLVEHAVVVGDGRPFVAALVTIDEAQFRSWRMHRPDVPVSVTDAIDHPELRAAIQEAVEHTNKQVSRAESIRAFAVLPGAFTVAGGELTPTLKVRRGVVAGRFAPLIDRIYKRSASMHNGSADRRRAVAGARLTQDVAS
jgi:long-chain acyl-CoA synthetase